MAPLEESLWLAVGVGCGAVVGTANYVVESCGFWLCQRLAARCHLSRLSRGAGSELREHHLSNILTVAIPSAPLYWLVARTWSQPNGFGSRMDLSCSPVSIIGFVWLAMIAHDCWFFVLHTCFHKCKTCFKYLHQQHHTYGSNISTLGTAYGTAGDIAACFTLFHGLVYLALSLMKSWNLPAVITFITFEVLTNVTGHCGYELPYWLHALVTGGAGLLPLAATSRTHYIHHLNPRVNRGLYFTVWDRCLGTFADEHSLCAPARSSSLMESRSS